MITLTRVSLSIIAMISLVSCDPSYNAYNVTEEVVSSDEKSNNELIIIPEKKCELNDRLEENLEASLHILKAEYITDFSISKDLKSYLDEEKIITIKESFLVQQIDIPPRPYDIGIPHLEHESIIDPRDGNDDELNEYYRIRYDGYINPTSSSYEGTYQIGILSDDGVILSVDNKVIVENTRTHSATLNCGQDLIELSIDKPIALALDYSQGPRNRLANTLLWRKVDTTRAVDTSLCGKVYHHRPSSGVVIDVMAKVDAAGWEIIPREVLARDTKTCD